MDLHAWITRQVERTEVLIGEGEWPPSQSEGVRLRCEADRRVLARHRSDPNADGAHAVACDGCGYEWVQDYSDPFVDNLNDCPELLDLAHAHGLTEEILAGLDRPQAPEPKPRAKVAHTPAGAWSIARALATQPITTSDVPEALRGPRWKP